MDCEKIQENLVAYSFGELPLEAVMEIHQHLGVCPTCAAEEIEIRRTSRRLSRIQPVPLADDFAAGLARKLNRPSEAIAEKTPGRFRWLYAAAAAILLVLGIEFFPQFFSTRPDKLTAYSPGRAIFNAPKATASSNWKQAFLEKYREKSVF